MNKTLHFLSNSLQQFMVTFSIVFSIAQCSAQTIRRESIASSGISILSEGILIQQTIGQPFFTAGFYSEEFSIHPGFQQSNLIMNTEVISSTFDLRLSVYPNPAANLVNIVSDGIIKNASLQVTDIAGKLMLNETIFELKSYQINCEAFLSGLYIITISDAKNNRYSSKLIITK